jgi:DNA-binding IclR family transcriptional regulator
VPPPPPHATSIGKVLLAWGDPEVRRQVLADGLKRYARNTITDPKQFEAELALVYQRGYATDLEEFEDGLCCVAAPVRDMTGRVVAAVGVAAPCFRMTAGVLPGTVEAVIEAGEAISKQLGHVHPRLPLPAVNGA